MKKEKIIPRKRLENESEKDYKLYLREFYFNLNPPKPSTRYDFAYENNLVDSAEVMDGKDGLYVKYLEEFYNDYYAALEQKVNFAFHMPNSLLDSKYIEKQNKAKKTVIKDKLSSIKNKFSKKEKKEKTKKESKIKSIVNNFKDRKKTKKEKPKKESKIKTIINNFKDRKNNRKEKPKKESKFRTIINNLKNKKKDKKEKTTILDKLIKILPKAILVVSSISIVSSLFAIAGGGATVGVVGLIASIAAFGAGIFLDNSVSLISGTEKSKKAKIKTTKTTSKENKKNKKQKGKLLSLFSRNKKNKTKKNDNEPELEFDTKAVVEEESELEFDTKAVVEEEPELEFDTKAVVEEEPEFEFDTEAVVEEEPEFEFDTDSTYGIHGNTYRLTREQLIDNKLEFTKPISRNNINIEEFTEPKRIEQKNKVKQLEMKNK